LIVIVVCTEQVTQNVPGVRHGGEVYTLFVGRRCQPVIGTPRAGLTM
jgi:hypothetical protein